MYVYIFIYLYMKKWKNAMTKIKTINAFRSLEIGIHAKSIAQLREILLSQFDRFDSAVVI